MLLIVIIFLIIASTAGQFSTYLLGHNKVLGLVRLFYLNTEANIPNWYESIALLVCSILLAVIAFTKKTKNDKYHTHWTVLSIIFLYLSIEEAAQIHELIYTGFLISLSRLHGIFNFAWVIIGIPFVLIFVIAYLKFLTDLHVKIRGLFILSGALLVGGALGMELVGGWYASLNGTNNLLYAMMTSIEESLEMLGSASFIYTLLTYMSLYLKEEVVFSFQEENDSTNK